ncbi:MAG TPA: hypothetical protein VFO60_01760 [Candidatus Dormibacteraeota bacterium]|nr:hypothetical protein [Candidatus Dormibacteraeota bacterium]
MATPRRMPGGVVPRPDRGSRKAGDGVAGPRPQDAPFDPSKRPLGLIAETWVPTQEPGAVRDELVPPPSAEPVRGGPSLTVWIIVLVVVAVVLLAVVSYRNAPP